MTTEPVQVSSHNVARSNLNNIAAANNSYAPRRSNVASNIAMSDGDVWVERLAVCEGLNQDGTPRLTVRSFYRNTRTSQRVWDEPPSGAAEIQYATPEMRHKADLQLEDLQSTLDMIPEDSQKNDESPVNNNDSSNYNSSNKKEKKGSFFRRLRSNKKKMPTLKDESKDLNLQRAIARSMMDQKHAYSFSTEPVVYYDTETADPHLLPMDDDLEMAKALSLSEMRAKHDNDKGAKSKKIRYYDYNDQDIDVNEMTEEEMIQYALRESELDAQRVTTPGYVPPPPMDFHDFTPTPPSTSTKRLVKQHYK